MKLLSFIKKHYIATIITSTLLYSLLSYILLFRSKAVDGIAHFYPDAERFLFETRTFLLNYNLNTVPTVLFGLIFLFAFLAYFIGLKINLPVKKTIAIAILLQVISFFAFPIIESDIFSYMSSDRVTTVYNQNVWKVAPSSLPFDKFSELADWKEFTRVYGWTNQFIYNIAAKAGNNDLVLTLISYKLVVFIFTLLSIYAVYRIANEFFSGNEANFIKLIFWNPLFLLEIVGAGHNDIIMLFFMLVSFYLYLKNNYLLSGLSLAIAAQEKLIGAALFPFLLINLIAKKQYKKSFLFSSTFLTIFLFIFVFMDTNPIQFALRALNNSGVFWQGLPSLIFNLTGSKTPIFLFGFAIFNLILFFVQFKTKKNPIYFYIISMTAYLTFFASAYWNWYVLWAFAFVPFIENRSLKISLLALTATSTFAYVLYWISLRFGYQNITWSILTYLFIFMIPFATYIYYQYRPHLNKKIQLTRPTS